MPRYGGSPLHLRIAIHRMFGPFAEKNAAVRLEMAQEIKALHRSSDDFDGLASNAFTALGLSQFAVCFEQQ